MLCVYLHGLGLVRHAGLVINRRDVHSERVAQVQIHMIRLALHATQHHHHLLSVALLLVVLILLFVIACTCSSGGSGSQAGTHVVLLSGQSHLLHLRVIGLAALQLLLDGSQVLVLGGVDRSSQGDELRGLVGFQLDSVEPLRVFVADELGGVVAPAETVQ